MLPPLLIKTFILLDFFFFKALPATRLDKVLEFELLDFKPDFSYALYLIPFFLLDLFSLLLS